MGLPDAFLFMEDRVSGELEGFDEKVERLGLKVEQSALNVERLQGKV